MTKKKYMFQGEELKVGDKLYRLYDGKFNKIVTVENIKKSLFTEGYIKLKEDSCRYSLGNGIHIVDKICPYKLSRQADGYKDFEKILSLDEKFVKAMIKGINNRNITWERKDNNIHPFELYYCEKYDLWVSYNGYEKFSIRSKDGNIVFNEISINVSGNPVRDAIRESFGSFNKLFNKVIEENGE
jgi:hypothetical protein